MARKTKQESCTPTNKNRGSAYYDAFSRFTQLSLILLKSYMVVGSQLITSCINSNLSGTN